MALRLLVVVKRFVSSYPSGKRTRLAWSPTKPRDRGVYLPLEKISMRFAGRAECNESCSLSSKEASLSNLKHARCFCIAAKTLEVIQRFYPIKFCSFLAPMRGDTDKLAVVFCCKPSMFKVVWQPIAAKSIRGVRFHQMGRSTLSGVGSHEPGDRPCRSVTASGSRVSPWA